MPSTKELSSVRLSETGRASNASRRSQKRSSSNSRRGRSSKRSKRHSTRSSKASKKKAKQALKRKKELEVMYEARTRQAGLQAMRAIVVSMQIVTTVVMMAAFIFAVFDTLSPEQLWFYVPSVFIEIYLAILGICLVFLYKTGLRWLFWLSYISILIADILVLFYIGREYGKGEVQWNCSLESSSSCSKITGVDIHVHMYMLSCFLVLMHAVVLILSLCWRECHDGSMDQLMENKLGQRLIKKHSSRNGSVRSKRSSKARLTVKKRSISQTETVHFVNRKSQQFAHQIVAKDGSSRTGIVVSSTSEVRTHQPKKCRKTVVQDCKLYLGTGEKVIQFAAVPTIVVQQTIDCNRDNCVEMRKNAVSDFDDIAQCIATSNVFANQPDCESQRSKKH